MESWQLTSFYHTVENVAFTEGNHTVALRFAMSGASYDYASYGSNQHWEISDLTLSDNNYLIYGIVNDINDDPINGVIITVDGGSVSTDTNGYYQIIADTGTHTLTTSKPGYTSNSSSVTVVASDVEYDIQLIETLTLDGYITNDLGDTVSGAYVLLSDNAGNDISDSTGYYNISNIDNGIYTIGVSEALHYDYTDAVSITDDTKKDILLTLLPTGPEPPVVAPPPFIEATPIPILLPVEQQTPLTIIIEEIITLISSPFNWIIILFTYLGAVIGRLISNDDYDEMGSILASVGLYGTLAWILILIINFFVPIITDNGIISIITFFLAGFVVSLILSGKE